MRDQQHTPTRPDPQVEPQGSSAFFTHCYRNALDSLSSALAEDRPLSILIGEGKSASSFVISTFLASLDENVAQVRITKPCSNAIDLMRKIVRSVGFQPKEMNAADLDSIFSMFLSFQKSHGHRTVICIEELNDSELWVLDKIRALVELEVEGGYGLMLIITGQPGLTELFNSRPLSSISAQAGQRISLAPFTLADTKEYIRRRVEAAGTSIIDQVFQYHAIPLVHELCAGVPDAIAALVSQCIEMADDEGANSVTTTIVKKAYEKGRAASEPQEPGTSATTVEVQTIMPPIGRLVVHLTDEDVQEYALRQGHILIGRSELCDIHIDSPIVSRHHALISYLPGGPTIVDLGSTNGTFVEGVEITQHELVPGDTIAVGDCRIAYVVDDDLRARSRHTEQSAGVELRRVGLS